MKTSDPKRGLRNYQQSAYDTALKYVGGYAKGEDPVDKACILCLPTGSGKTVIMGALALRTPQIREVLILSPRVSVADQLFREMSGDLYIKLGLDPATITKSVGHLKAGTHTPRTGKRPRVLISTIQKIDRMRSRRAAEFNQLVSQIDLLVFDEGHYEPAISWRRAVRSFDCPRVIFTATPFRNDWRLFDADLNRSHFYSFDEAVKKRWIRDVVVSRVDETRTPRSFMDRVIETYQREIGTLDASRARILIRCDSLPRILEVQAEVERRGLTSVAIHERMQVDRKASRWRRVPNPKTTDALIWIHQFKLMEGIDEPRFQLLGIYDALGNTRSVIQQIGRIIRVRSRAKQEIAYVIDGSHAGNVAKWWEEYRAFDRAVDPSRLADLDFSAHLIKVAQQSSGTLRYVNGEFRRPLFLDDWGPERDLLLPLSTTLRARSDNFDTELLRKHLHRRLEEADRILGPMGGPVPDSIVALSVSFRNSPLLAETSFLEPKLIATVIYAVDDLVCCYDSAGLSLDELPGLGRPLRSRDLRRALHEHPKLQVKRVGLVHSSTSEYVVRRKDIAATSIRNLPPALDDSGYIVTAAEGVYPDGLHRRTRRVTYGRASVADRVGSARKNISEYFGWLNEVAALVSKPRAVPAAALARYADSTVNPHDPKPRSILLEAGDDLPDRFVTNPVGGDSGGVPLELEDLVTSVADDGSFSAKFNGSQCRCKVQWDGSGYFVESHDLESKYRATDGGSDLVRTINEEGLFRVLPKTKGVIWTRGDFYRPSIQFGAQGADKHSQLLDVIHDFDALDRVTSEKGEGQARPGGTGWPVGGQFDLIDRLARKDKPSKIEAKMQSFFDHTDLLVCDDMGTELADFVLCQRSPEGRKRLVLLHAKCARPADASSVSASALSVVCSQAVKNLGSIHEFADRPFTRAEKWDEPHSCKEVRGRVLRRTRIGPSNGQDAWNHYRSYVEDPACQREVWLFLGNLLSKVELKKQLQRSNPRLETEQIVYLLLSTSSAVQGAQATLRVFCGRSPSKTK